MLQGLKIAADHDMGTELRRNEILQETIDRVNSVPIYLRQGIKMLTKAVQDHDRLSGIIEEANNEN